MLRIAPDSTRYALRAAVAAYFETVSASLPHAGAVTVDYTIDGFGDASLMVVVHDNRDIEIHGETI